MNDAAVKSAMQAIEAREAMAKRPFTASIILGPDRTAVVQFPRDITDAEALTIVRTFLGEPLQDARKAAQVGIGPPPGLVT